ncbi:MAG TPA: low affinity iron permease family protein [Chloroflexota bacterium]|jgi:low affinity Fe/Cu permease|nr:low affinity iron permease family protein [Chloroflexota bacterium]
MYPYRRTWFARFAKWAAHAAGHPVAFGLAALIIVAWLVSGPLFGFSDTWQLVINTGTTIITFLMVFLIQNTQNRDSVAVQLKLDELIRSAGGANNALLDLEELLEPDLERLREEYEALARQARAGAGPGRRGRVRGRRPPRRRGRSNSRAGTRPGAQAGQG